MTKYIFFAGGMEEGNRAMKLRSTAVMSTSALTWRSSCPVLSVRIARSCFRTGFTQFQSSPWWVRRRPSSPLRGWNRQVRGADQGSDLGRWHWTTENTFRSRNATSAGGARYRRECRRDCSHRASRAPRSNTFAMRCLTTRLWRKPTSWRPWTG